MKEEQKTPVIKSDGQRYGKVRKIVKRYCLKIFTF